jgi:hypothetical protein
MRQALIGIALLLSGGTAMAQDYTTSQYCSPWCSEGRKSGGLDCAYSNFEQCQATESALGGRCIQNPFLSQCTRPAPRQRRNR